MALRIPATPALPLPPSTGDIRVLGRYASHLHSGLFKILAEIASRLNLAFPSDGSEPLSVPLPLASFTVTELGSMTATAGLLVYVSDETDGAVLAFGDGSDWRRVTDRAVVS